MSNISDILAGLLAEGVHWDVDEQISYDIVHVAKDNGQWAVVQQDMAFNSFEASVMLDSEAIDFAEAMPKSWYVAQLDWDQPESQMDGRVVTAYAFFDDKLVPVRVIFAALTTPLDHMPEITDYTVVAKQVIQSVADRIVED